MQCIYVSRLPYCCEVLIHAYTTHSYVLRQVLIHVCIHCILPNICIHTTTNALTNALRMHTYVSRFNYFSRVLHIRSGTLGFQLCRVRRFFTGDGPAWTLHCIMCTDWPFWVVLWEGLKFKVTSLWRDNAAHTVIPFFACLPYYYWLNEVDPFCSSSTPVRSLQSKLHAAAFLMHCILTKCRVSKSTEMF